MLLQFRVKNVKSYREETILDYSAMNFDDHTNHVFENNGNNILPIVTIYGANSAGKTNILSAFSEMCEFIKTSVEYAEDKKKSFFVLSTFIYNTTTYRKPIEFEVTLSADLDYRYGFSILDGSIVETEYLEFRKSPNGSFLTIFERNRNKKIQIGKSSVLDKDEVKQLKFVSEFIRERELLLTMLGRRQQSVKLGILSRYATLYEWFSNVQNCPTCGNENKKFSTAVEEPQIFNFFSNDAATDDYLQFIQKADPTIKGLSLERAKGSDEESEKHIVAHRQLVKDQEGIGNVTLPTFLESSGTKYIMQSYPIVKTTLQQGGLLIADEIDRSLHPSLLLDVINLFTNPDTNPNHAQLLCTMHNVIIMDKRFLRRDEIWFVEKNERGESCLYSLADFKLNDKTVRNDADFCKNYILGMYGAIPEK